MNENGSMSEGPSQADEEMLPADRLIECRIVVRLPVAATKKQILEAVSHEVGYGSCDINNPLLDRGIDVVSEPVLRDTRQRYCQRRSPLPNGTVRIRSWAEPDNR